MPSAIEGIHKGRSSVYKLERKFIALRSAKDPGRNPRTDFGDIEALAKLVGQHGIIIPLEGTLEEKKFLVGHGERRLAAWDYAVEKGWLDKKSEKAWIPVRSEGFKAGTADKDRLVHHVILNEAKPLDQFEKGRAFLRLMDDHGMKEKEVATELGFSITAVRDCLRLVRDAAPGVQEAVKDGKLSPTAAIDLVRETPDQQAQEEILEKGVQTAAAQGKDKVTAKHLPITTGKAAQASRRRGRDPFEGKNSTPDAPASNAHGDFVENVTACQIPLNSSKVQATVLTALVGGTYHIGWRVTIPGQGKGEGFVQVHPRVDGPSADTEALAILRGLHQIRAEIELKTFKGKGETLHEIDTRLQQSAVSDVSTPAPKKSGGAPANPVIKDRDAIGELKEIVGSIQASDAEKDRLATAKKILGFMKGKIEGKDLTRYILGIG